jgi:hypothetical protein
MYRSDQVHCVASSPITMPWDPCAHSGQTKRDVPLHSVLAVWASHQLIVWRLEDPDNSSSCRPAWGQAGFQGEGNVMDRTMRLGRGAGWAGLWAEGSGTCSYKRQTPGRREGRTERIPELFPDLHLVSSRIPCISRSCHESASIYSQTLDSLYNLPSLCIMATHVRDKQVARNVKSIDN